MTEGPQTEHRLIHQNRHPGTGGCLDCGASHEQIDDNLFPTCEKAEGPHRLAIIAVRQAAMHSHYEAQWHDRLLADNERAAEAHEKAAVYHAREKQRAEADEVALRESLKVLLDADGPKEERITAGQAIGRTVHLGRLW